MERRLKQDLRLIQVRDKNLSNRTEFAKDAVGLAHRYGARVLVNGDAAGMDADGVHYTAKQLMALRERPKDGFAAASCHTREELERAMQLALDFVVLGPVKETASHAGAAILGWDGFAAMARGASIPVYAIGGLKSTDLKPAWRAGAHGVAMIRGSWG